MSDYKEMMKELEVLLRGKGDESFTMLLKLPDVLGTILAFLQSDDMRREERYRQTEEKLESLIAALRDHLVRADERQQLGRSLVEERARVMHLERVNAQLKGENAQLKGENAQLKGENAQLKGENAQLKGENAQLRAPLDENAVIAESFSRIVQRLQEAEAALAALKQSRIVETSRRLNSKVPELVATARAATEQAQNEVANLQHEIKNVRLAEELDRAR